MGFVKLDWHVQISKRILREHPKQENTKKGPDPPKKKTKKKTESNNPKKKRKSPQNKQTRKTYKNHNQPKGSFAPISKHPPSSLAACVARRSTLLGRLDLHLWRTQLLAELRAEEKTSKRAGKKLLGDFSFVLMFVKKRGLLEGYRLCVWWAWRVLR